MLVLDANILIRAVLGSRVLDLLTRYSDRVDFFTPDVAFYEARQHLPPILEKRNVPAAPAMAAMDAIYRLIQMVDRDTYASFELVARPAPRTPRRE